jgi:hypothetical protein
MHLSPEFTATVQRIFREKGREWLPRLPDILARCRNQWGLALGIPCPTMSMNYIEFTTTAAGQPVALKVGVPHGELFTEVGRFLHNQLPGARREELLRERVGILSVELGYAPETVAASGLVDCVLSHCWSFEDSELEPDASSGDDWHIGIELARVLCEMAGV